MAVSKITEDIDLDKVLGRLPIEMRGKALTKGLRLAGNIVNRRAKRLAPVGDPSHRPDNKALKDTIITKTKEYQNGTKHLVIVGPTYSKKKGEGGQHGHLVDGGHKVIVSRGERKGSVPLSGSAYVEGKRWFAPAIDGTKKQVDDKVVTSIQTVIKKAGG